MAAVTDNLVRLVLAITAIVVITAFLYGFGAPEAVAIEPSASALSAK